jgi:hypothetical protein
LAIKSRRGGRRTPIAPTISLLLGLAVPPIKSEITATSHQKDPLLDLSPL